MSRIRTAILIRPARSICVPPTSTRIAVADIVLDGGRKPRRRQVEIDRPGAEPPPQPAETGQKIAAITAITTAQAFDPASAGHPAQRRKPATEPIKSGTATRQQPARAGARRLVVLIVPAGRIIPMWDLSLGTRISTPWAKYS